MGLIDFIFSLHNFSTFFHSVTAFCARIFLSSLEHARDMAERMTEYYG
jgi:hypothetical protein